MEELQLVEHIVREDEGVVEQCVISGIPREDMHKVHCDRKCSSFPSLFLFLSLFLSDWHWRRVFMQYIYTVVFNVAYL